MNTRRSAALTAVMTAAVLLTACGGDPPPVPDGPSAIRSCVTDSGDLITDVDADGHADRVSDPSHTGKQLAIAFGKDGDAGGYGDPVGVRHLAGGDTDRGDDVLAAVTDFDRDGWADLMVVATEPPTGYDDPITPEFAEVRLGPFSRDGVGQHARDLDLGETRGVAVADYDHDRYPDLAAYVYAGDGVYETQARLGSGAAGLADSGVASRRYTVVAERTDDSNPSNLPQTGLGHFHPSC